MQILSEIYPLIILSVAVASIAWTVTQEEIFREPREYCKDRSENCATIFQRKFFYVFTCEYCFSHSVTEAVANMLMHRDLALRDVPSRILIYDKAIEFVNPRRTNGFVPPASRAIRYGIAQRINPQIASIFSRREYGTSVPRGGLPMILKGSHNFSGRRAEIYTSGDEFKLKIYSM